MISDNNHITYSAEDIQRYWNGQLSPQEMHAMEKAALDDPFLADAMEGMGEAMRVHDEQLVNAELTTLHQQLEARKEEKRPATPVRRMKWWPAAAAAMILVVGGYWIFTSNQDLKENEVSQLTTVHSNKKATAPAVADSNTTYKDGFSDLVNVTDSNMTAGAGNTDSGTQTDAYLSAKKPEPGIFKFKTPEENTNKDTLFLNPDIKAKTFANVIEKKPEAEEQRASGVIDRNASKAAPLSSIKMDTPRPVATEVVQLPGDFFAKTSERKQLQNTDVKLQNIVKGVVTDNKNNPLANAFIRLDDKSGYTTDLKGSFNIPVTDTVVQVSVSLAGYNTQNFRLRTDDFNNAGRINQNQIQLQPDNAQLNEVVVSGYATKRKSGGFDQKTEYYRTADIQNATPTYGWLAYEEYIEKNKRVPADNPNLVGEVVLTFAVNKRGELSEFKVEKSLSPLHDAEAQRLVRQGPSWKLLKGRKSRVTVIVRF